MIFDDHFTCPAKLLSHVRLEERLSQKIYLQCTLLKAITSNVLQQNKKPRKR